MCLTFILAGCAGNPAATSYPAPSAGDVLQVNGDGTCLDVETHKIWQMARHGRFSSRRDAVEYVKTLSLANQKDWRLPTRDELLRLHRIILWKKNGDCSMDLRGDYWSASPDRDESPGHWETYYLCGPEFKYIESSRPTGYVRAVRP